jgi:hypothetical protein
MEFSVVSVAVYSRGSRRSRLGGHRGAQAAYRVPAGAVSSESSVAIAATVRISLDS